MTEDAYLSHPFVETRVRGCTTLLLLLVVVASSLGPALRASGIHPMEALRQE
jgi:ABC-type lipoprotein release transport system permease subunit